MKIKSLVCLAGLFLVVISGVKDGVANELKITSFETDEDLAKIEKSIGVILERSMEHVTHGEYSLKVTFLADASGKDPSIRTEYPQRIFFSIRYPNYPTRDFSKYDFLEMDIYYDRAPFEPPFTTAATVEFMDSNGNFRPGWAPLSVYPGKQETARVTISLGMTNISDKSKFSFSDVARIDISAPIPNAYPSVPKEDFSVYFDNIRLVSSAPQIPSKEEILSAISSPQLKKINEKIIPFQDGDIKFRVQAYAHFSEGGNLSMDKLLSLEEDIGLKKNNELVVEVQPLFLIRFFNEAYLPTEKDWQDFALTIQTLYQNKTSFVLLPFNFWAGRLKYQTTVDVMSKLIELSSEIGNEYFVGVRLSEPEAISVPGAGYMRFEEKEKDLEKIDSFVDIVKTFVKDIGLSEDKLLFLDVSHPIPYDWLFASGADVAGQAFLPILPIELSESTLRGMAGSFNKWWEWQITRWPMGESQSLPLPFDPKTGRPRDTVQEFDKHFFSRRWTGKKEFSGRDEEVFSGDVHKMYLSSYFSGARMINAFSEDPHRKPYREAMTKFMEFVRDNPRGKEVVSRIAVVKSKGCRWEIPRVITPGYPSSPKNIQDLDFLYLNAFFPGFSDDGMSAKYWWTGTPYGSVDLIYPRMSLEEMKKYNVLIFLGYNRMDAVRPDFLNDLMKYVSDGGTVVISIEQLRNMQGGMDEEKLEKFLGVKIEDTFPSAPKKRINEYIEVNEGTPFKFVNKKYAVSPEGTSAYKVIPQGADRKFVEVARDGKGNPVLLLNNYGKGCILLFTVPKLSEISPEGKSPFIQDILDKVCSYKPLPVDISPKRPDIAFTMSKSENKEAAVFLMNHGEKDWSGEIIINLKEAGLSPEAAGRVTVKAGKGYETKEVVPQIKMDNDNLIVSGITLSGDMDDFCSYRQASFAYIRLWGK